LLLVLAAGMCKAMN